MVRRNAFGLAVVVGGLGCGFDADGLAGGSGNFPDAEGSTGTASTGQVEDPSGMPDPTGNGSNGPPGPSTTGPDPSGPGDGSGGEATTAGTSTGVEYPASCAVLLAESPDVPSGVYSFDGFSAYCDMETDGGGWTLVARSVSGTSAAFGWSVGRGSPDDDEVPYSLDVSNLVEGFSEVLIGEYDEGKGWGTHVYQVTLAANFTDEGGQASLANESVATVAGDCDPDGGPEIFRYFGHLQRADRYFFRDIEDVDNSVGLWPDGFSTWWNNGTNACRIGADLDGRQGMIFVR